ncbi:type 1 glutamine amidotransferase domain-containing protein [Paracoccus salipaludis]|uniref:Glutamine amidotransferase n=1 Tax=Paracoccus salipaludis TaxID=2032623 RepID=A0A2A2GP88_9RHOB|nr:type 1 glutamine amidotransferase domain-containing protein [Paracoccus salipaludis]PAU98847.1 glutamine amidotransferase [Paracoccus salipaludis]
MQKKPRILIITTSAATMTDSDKPTGLWLEELTTPYYAFLDAGAEVTLASIAGGKVPVDPNSVKPRGENDPSVERAMQDRVFQTLIGDTLRFDTLDTTGFDAIMLPGGHGTMFDYPESAELAKLVADFDAAGKVVAAVCHGPAGLVGARRADGTPVVAGRRVAAFTDSEEQAVGLADAVPFLLTTRLKKLGAVIEAGPDFEPFAIRDGNLVTGQNPASAEPIAKLVFEALDEAKGA